MEGIGCLAQTIRSSTRLLGKKKPALPATSLARRCFRLPTAPRQPRQPSARPPLQKNLVSKRPGPSQLSQKSQLRETSSLNTTPPDAAGATGEPSAATAAEEDQGARLDVPSYDITFTCKPCFHRSTHRISKQGYFKGTVIITCPNCQARHLISDHLRIFRDQSTTIEDILREKGEIFKKGRLSPDGDLQIWQSPEGAESFSETRNYKNRNKRKPVEKPEEDSLPS